MPILSPTGASKAFIRNTELGRGTVLQTLTECEAGQVGCFWLCGTIRLPDVNRPIAGYQRLTPGFWVPSPDSVLPVPAFGVASGHVGPANRGRVESPAKRGCEVNGTHRQRYLFPRQSTATLPFDPLLNTRHRCLVGIFVAPMAKNDYAAVSWRRAQPQIRDDNPLRFAWLATKYASKVAISISMIAK